MVWSTSRDKAKELMQLSDSEFVENLNEAFTRANKSVISVNALSDLIKNVMSTVQPGKLKLRYFQSLPVKRNSKTMGSQLLEHMN